MSTDSDPIASDIRRTLQALDSAGYLRGESGSDGEQRMFCPACEDPGASRSPSASFNIEDGMFNCLKSGSEHGGPLPKLHRFMVERGLTTGELSASTLTAARERKARPLASPQTLSDNLRLRHERSELRLWEGDEIATDYLRFLEEERGLSEDTIQRAALGLENIGEGDTAEWRITIPVVSEGRIINVRRYLPHAEDRKIISVSGHGSGAFLYNADALAQHSDLPVLLCESELDALLAQQESEGLFVAVTGTGGASTVPADIGRLSNRKVYIAYDADEAGAIGSAKVAKRLQDLGGHPAIIDLTTLGLPPGSGQDITDLLLEHATAHGIAAAFDTATADLDAVSRQSRVAALVEEGRAREGARQVLAADEWEPPVDHGSWAEQIENPPEPVAWRIDQLLYDGANVMLNAVTKAGKTVLSLNVARCLLSGEKLFGAFTVEPVAEGRSVAWWNAELSRTQAHDWLHKMRFQDVRPGSFFPHHLRGYTMPFDSPIVEENTVRWLRERNVSVWVLDPKAALFTGDENSNTETNAWLRAIDRIKRRAGVDIVIIVHHASESAVDDSETPRIVLGRGASRQEGWADIIWSYSGRFNEPRYLSALGRDVDLAPFGGLHMESATKSLFWNGNVATPHEVKMLDLAQQMYSALAVGSLNATDLKGKVTGKTDNVRQALTYAIQKGYIRQTPGSGNSKLHSRGDIDPFSVSLSGERVSKFRITSESDEQEAAK